MRRLDGKIALVTGAASGIGEAIAQAFVAEGAVVILSDIADDAGSTKSASLGSAASYMHLDVREEEDWETCINRILRQHDNFDVLVNNAGITGFEQSSALHDPERASLEDWHAVLATNLGGVFLGCKHARRICRDSQTVLKMRREAHSEEQSIRGNRPTGACFGVAEILRIDPRTRP